jgi:hypothetical protein
MSTLVQREMKNCELASETSTFYVGVSGNADEDFFVNIGSEAYWYKNIPILDKVLSHWAFGFTPQIFSIICWMVIISFLYGVTSLLMFTMLIPSIVVVAALIRLFDVY